MFSLMAHVWAPKGQHCPGKWPGTLGDNVVAIGCNLIVMCCEGLRGCLTEAGLGLSSSFLPGAGLARQPLFRYRKTPSLGSRDSQLTRTERHTG